MEVIDEIEHEDGSAEKYYSALYHTNVRCQCSDDEACSLLFKAPEGYVLVPVEPTEAMLNAGLDANVVPHPEDIYKAMIQAAQEEE